MVRRRSPLAKSAAQALSYWFSQPSIMAIIVSALASSEPTVAEELSLTGAGTGQCQLINTNAAPGRGPNQDVATMIIFSWVQGYLSGFNSYWLVGGNPAPFDLGKVTQEIQWEYIVSYCQSHPAAFIIKAIQDLQLKLLQK